MPSPRGRRAWPELVCVAVLLLVIAGCGGRHHPDEQPYVPPDPIPVHVKNDNFLDMKIAVVSGGVARRLGDVTGNASANFTIPWSVVNGQSIVLTATPIGGRGAYVSSSVSLGAGQELELRIGSALNQSAIAVRSPDPM